MDKRELASMIMSGADKLRGKVSAAEYKDYILGLIFYKFLSEKEENYLKNVLEFEEDEICNINEVDYQDEVNSCKKNLGYFISYKNLFSTWLKKDSNFSFGTLTNALNAFNNNISEDFLEVYSGIFDSLSSSLSESTLGNVDTAKGKAVKKLIKLINRIPNNDSNQGYDVLGFIYEYLLKNFAASAGKAGEFYTPHEASVIMSEIIAHHLKDKNEITIYDPTSGSGSLLINIGSAVAQHLNNPNGVAYYAQELINSTYNLTRMNLVMRGVLPSNIFVRRGDTLDEDWPFFEEKTDKAHVMIPVDAVASNPPYSQKWSPKNDIRYKEYGLAPDDKADYAFLLHSLYHLKADGIMAIVLPHGVLFRGGAEKAIREKLIEKHNIETIIGLPKNCFFGTGISTIIMILKKQRKESDILFIDASEDFIKDGNKNRLRDRDVRKIVDTVIERKEGDGIYSKLVSLEEIKANEYNLNISRYITQAPKEPSHDIYSMMFGGIPNSEIDLLDNFWDAFPSLRKSLFTPKNDDYSYLVEGSKDIIDNNSDVVKFIDNYKTSFIPLKDQMKIDLFSNLENKSFSIEKEKNILADKIREISDSNILVDYYDAYEVFSNAWVDIKMDFETLNKEGLSSANKVVPNLVEPSDKSKKKKKSEDDDDVLNLIQKGFKGYVLPYDLIQDLYFKDGFKKLKGLEEELDGFNSEKEELLNSINQDDKEAILKDDSDEDIDNNKLKKEISAVKKLAKKGNIFEEGSYEDILINVDKLNKKIKDIKKDIKELKTDLDDSTRNKIENLSKEELLYCLENKWINPLYDSIVVLSNNKVKELKDKVNALADKYSETIVENDKEIHRVSMELAGLMRELTGNSYDMQGLDEFRKLLGDDDE